MAKNKNNQPQNNSKNNQKFRLKEQNATVEKNNQATQQQNKNENKEF